MKTLHDAHLAEIKRKADRGPWPPAWLNSDTSVDEAQKETIHAYSFVTQIPHSNPDQAVRYAYIVELMNEIWRELNEGWGEW
jgi:hypothetical protein